MCTKFLLSATVLTITIGYSGFDGQSAKTNGQLSSIIFQMSAIIF